jgi:hypothetical protein
MSGRAAFVYVQAPTRSVAACMHDVDSPPLVHQLVRHRANSVAGRAFLLGCRWWGAGRRRHRDHVTNNGDWIVGGGDIHIHTALRGVGEDWMWRSIRWWFECGRNWCVTTVAVTRRTATTRNDEWVAPSGSWDDRKVKVLLVIVGI